MTVYNQRPKNIKLGSDKISSVTRHLVKMSSARSVKFKKSDKLSRKEIKKLKPGESYITKNDKLAWRRSSKEIWRDNFSMILRGIIFPFYRVYKFLNKRCYDFFYPRTNAKWNGIIGPGGYTSYERNFSWGKLSFILIVLFILVYFVFLR